MSTSADAFVAEGGLKDDFVAKSGTDPQWTPDHGYRTETWGSDPRFKIGGSLHGWFHGVVGSAGYAWEDGTKAGPDPNGFSSFAGVLGTGVYVTGVAGTSIIGSGVYGQAGEDPDQSIPTNDVVLSGGVVGASIPRPGVSGWSLSNIGVYAVSHSPTTAAVVANNPGGGTGVFGASGYSGPGTSGFSTSPGVYGTSDKEAGVVGTSRALMGVYGYSRDNAGVVGQSANPNSFGGFFFGNVMITGNLTVNGQLQTPNKQAVVAFPDGTQRVLYCMESPEYWFEDFGAAKLKRGRVVVKLADFANVIRRGDYHVFLTPRGDCRGLYVHRQAGASFEVRELAGGKSSVAFSYRIVGRRKDIRAPRFAKTDIHHSLSLPTSATRASRKGAPSTELRAFAARLEKETRGRRLKGAKRSRKFRAPPRGMTRPSIRPQL